MARSEESSQSDVDLLSVGEMTLAALAPVLKKAENSFSGPVNVRFFRLSKSAKDWPEEITSCVLSF
jgi:hypothetical protein